MGDLASPVAENLSKDQNLLCREFKELASLIIDNEASEEQKQRFLEFTQNCCHCSEYYQIEKSALTLIKVKASSQRFVCPQDLKDQIRKVSGGFK